MVDDDLARTQFLEDDVNKFVEVYLEGETLQDYRPVYTDGPIKGVNRWVNREYCHIAHVDMVFGLCKKFSRSTAP